MCISLFWYGLVIHYCISLRFTQFHIAAYLYPIASCIPPWMICKLVFPFQLFVRNGQTVLCLQLGSFPGYRRTVERNGQYWHLAQKNLDSMVSSRNWESSYPEAGWGSGLCRPHRPWFQTARVEVFPRCSCQFPTPSSRYWTQLGVQFMQLPSLLWSVPRRRTQLAAL